MLLPILQLIRSLNIGWLLLLIALVLYSAGLSMGKQPTDEDTWLCFDAGCVYVQSWSVLGLAVMTTGVGIYRLLQ